MANQYRRPGGFGSAAPKNRKPLGVREHQWDKVLKDAKERRRKNPHGAIVPKVVFGYAAPLGLVVCAQKWHSEEKQQIAALESLEKQMKNVEVEQAKLNEKLRTRTKEHGRLVKHVMKAMQAYARHLQVQRVDQHDLDSRLSNVNKTYNDFKPKLDSVIARFDMQDTPEASSALYTEPVQNSHRLNELLSLSKHLQSKQSGIQHMVDELRKDLHLLDQMKKHREAQRPM